LPELASPFGYKRAPAYQFISRLRDYKPHLKDVLIVSSTASADVGLITRSDHPLSSEESAKATVGRFVTTDVNDDAKKASVPLKDSVDETSVIGLAVDLSSSEPVIAPIQGADIDESSTPLPNVLLLNHEGILCSWWFIYNDSIRQKLPYHGLASVGPQQQQPVSQSQMTQPQTMAQPAFGQSAFGSSASPSAPAFGTPSFGKPSAPAFGSPSALAKPPQPSFGQPSFGTPAFGATAFGTPASLGSAAPQFGKSGFGQPSTPGKGFGSFAGTGATSGGGFGSFAGGGGFGSLAASKPSEGSPFSQVTSESPFAKASGLSAFGGQPDSNTAFAPQKTEDSKGAFGAGSGGFVLGSTFKGDGTAVNDAPKPEKSSGLFSFGSSFDEMVSAPSKPSPPTEAMDDMEDAIPQQNVAEEKASVPSLFGAPSKAVSATSLFNTFGSQAQTSQPFGSAPTAKSPFSIFGNTAMENKLPSPSSTPSEKTAIASPPPTLSKSLEPEITPVTSVPEAPLPPDPTSRAVYGPGDTSASSNVSKSSVDDAPLPPDFTAPRKSPEPKSEPPLPPDFTGKPKEEGSQQQAEEAPLPPDFTKPSVSFAKEPPQIPDGSDADESEKSSQEADESEFEDSGEDITHDLSQRGTNAPSVKSSPESSFDDKQADESSARSLFGHQHPRKLFGEINKPLFPQPSHVQGSPRSPSPVRPGRGRGGLPGLENFRSVSAPHKPGDALAARKASLSELAEREIRLKPEPKEPPPQPTVQAQEEPLSDDEDERLRADLSRPLEPVPTLDPFLPHQDYAGQTAKPGIPGQIERLYRDINSMVDTLGINARSLSAFLLYQQETTDPEWVNILKGDHPADILDEKSLLRQIEDLDNAVAVLVSSLEEQQVQKVEEKLDSCREILGKDILALRSQCASIRKTLDAHTDSAAILSAPLSAEQASLQQDLRASSADIQAKLADLESAVSLLRAKIADAPRADGSRQSTRRPTVEAVTSTIATMMNMVESKSSDIDVLEVQLKKLGIDTSAAPSSREGSPFATPRKGLGKLPTTPGSRGSLDGAITSYHTPESAARGMNFRSSISGSAKGSRLRAMETLGDLGNKRESAQWKAKMQRKQHIMSNLKKAIDEKKSKVRSVDDL
jgi:nucleoporin NUP159